MRGREVFRMIRPILSVGRGACRILPSSACHLILDILRYMPTKAGIALRYVLVSRLASSCGDNVAIFEGVHLFHVDRMSIGSNVSIHQMCYLDATGGITIGTDVAIAHATTIMSTSHIYSDSTITTRDATATFEPVSIHNDVWIGAGARILSGVTIGEHSVVAAGAVVTRDVEPNSLVAGVPARRLKTIRVGAI